MDYYYVHFQNGYDQYTDPTTNEPVFVATGPSNTKGFEAEANFALGYGFSLYTNVTKGSAKYQTGPNYPNGGKWVANTPSNVEGASLLWQHGNFDFGLTYKRVGEYFQDNGSLTYKVGGLSLPFPVDEAVSIRPWTLVNAFMNYTIKNTSHLRGTKIQLAVNNLGDSHSLVGLTPGVGPTASTAYTQSPLDQLNLMPGRSISLTITGGYAPRR
jgi:outer membrane receptor protein involved in Fe transport